MHIIYIIPKKYKKGKRKEQIIEKKETKKMGRPTDNPKIYQTRIRMTQEEWNKLEYCSKSLSKTKTEIVNLGIEKIYNTL